MKKVCTVFIILFLIFALVGCSLIADLDKGFNDNSSLGENTNPPNGENDNPIIDGGDKTDPIPNPTPDPIPDPTPVPIPDEFNDYGFPVIEINLLDYNIDQYGLYTSLAEVGGYIYLYHGLPSNFYTKSNRVTYTAQNKASVGGDRFYNREELLPNAKGRTYTECDIDYSGGSRNAKRIVFSSDWLIFYTSDHYASFSILRFYVA